MLFPVDSAGKPYFADAFDPRKGGHHGTDIFAPRGTAVYAVDHGRLRKMIGGKGGITIYLDADDGARYYYAHLASTVGRFPRTCLAGDPIATVGSTGNAAGKAPHLHFQMWTQSSGLINPYPHLRAALDHSPVTTPGWKPTAASNGEMHLTDTGQTVALILAGLAALWLMSKA